MVIIAKNLICHYDSKYNPNNSAGCCDFPRVCHLTFRKWLTPDYYRLKLGVRQSPRTELLNECSLFQYGIFISIPNRFVGFSLGGTTRLRQTIRIFIGRPDHRIWIFIGLTDIVLWIFTGPFDVESLIFPGYKEKFSILRCVARGKFRL